jgi:hypothetical protein
MKTGLMAGGGMLFWTLGMALGHMVLGIALGLIVGGLVVLRVAVFTRTSTDPA